MEFRDGYVLVHEAELSAVIEGYRTRELRRSELRVYAAVCEQKGLHRRSKVDLARILNCKSGMKGVKRLSGSEIEKGEAKVRATLKSVCGDESGRRIAVSRRMLRHAAKGAGTSNEIIVMLFYCMRRMRQRRKLVRLRENERYARFTYRDLEAVSGIPRANICRAVCRLRAKGIVNTAWVKKQNENQFGLLFVDGPLVSLTCPRQGANRRRKPSAISDKTTTPSAHIDNAPPYKTTTLKNDNPKTDYQKSFEGILSQKPSTKSGRWTEFDRIRQRAEQMKAEWVDQAA